ncbi:MAG: hypothetical protein ABIG93_02140 [archaeon]|nr:hypothetical protein [Nanoarchaeota archaeon]
MISLQQFENNVAKSFEIAKGDVEELYQHVYFVLKQMEELRQENATLAAEVAKLNAKVQSNSKKVAKSTVAMKTVKKSTKKKTTRKKATQKVVSSKTSNKVHDTSCPFAKNIKNSNKVIVGSKNEALRKGYKLCSCLTVF